MLRSLLVIGAVFCATLVLAEGLVLGYLWVAGHLSADTLRAVQLALQNPAGEETSAPATEPQVDIPSQEEILQARLMRILQLNAREAELEILKRMVSDAANQLISDRQALDQWKEAFRTELQRLEEQARGEAVEQVRTVLLALPPEDAAQRLLSLPHEDAVLLARGLPEKTIARILQALQADPQSAARGQKLFEALYRGEPKTTLIEHTLNQLQPSTSLARSSD
jgi:flagellar motility protein MotE (MotC chaperone)